MIIRRRPLCIAALVTAGLVLAACGPRPKADATAGQSASGANDQRTVDLMEMMRQRALKAPGSAPEALDFAYNVTQLYTQGVTQRRAISPTLVAEAVTSLDEARAQQPAMAADLLARKGELLLAAGQPEAGVGALRESIADRPNLRAFKPLIRHYEAAGAGKEIEPLCKRVLPAMKTEENRYLVLDECLKTSGAATPEAGLRWAGARELAFYKARKKELDARAAKQAKAKEAAETKK
jgi:hypothetical protein